jgi:hypothetical protein
MLPGVPVPHRNTIQNLINKCQNQELTEQTLQEIRACSQHSLPLLQALHNK